MCPLSRIKDPPGDCAFGENLCIDWPRVVDKLLSAQETISKVAIILPAECNRFGFGGGHDCSRFSAFLPWVAIPNLGGTKNSKEEQIHSEL